MKKPALFILLSCLLAAPYVMTSCKKDEMRPIGLQLYSLRDDMQRDPTGMIEKVGKIGYKFVETANYENGKFYNMEPDAFKALVEKNGMIFLSSHTGHDRPDSANWNSVMAWWDKCIADHKAAGVKYIVQPWMDSTAYSSLTQLKKYCNYFNSVGEKCKAAGILFGYHNHTEEFKDIEGQTIYDFMLKNTDSTKVFFQMDLWLITLGGKQPVDYFRKYPGRFLLWHVKDEKELGASGKINFKPIFENAALSGVEAYVVEQEEYTTTPIEGIEKSYKFLKNSAFLK